MKKLILLTLVGLQLKACSCVEEPPPLPSGEGILRAGCPEPGQAKAMRIEDPAQRMQGDWVLGKHGDYLLMNEKVAIVVQDTAPSRSYFEYGGNLIDAVALNGCEQAGPEQFGELSFVLGKFAADDFSQSVLKGFRGESVELVNDGSDGKSAVVRVHGSEGMFWLVEYELIRMAALSGDGKALTEPIGLRIALDYILAPGSSVLRMDLHLTNPTEETHEVMFGQVVFPADTTSTIAFSNGSLQLGGRSLPLQLPWISWSSGESAYAMARDYSDLGLLSVAGVNAIFNVTDMLQPIVIEAGETQTRTTLLSTAAGHHNDAIIALSGTLEQPLPSRTWHLEPLAGRVVDESTSMGLDDVTLRVQMRNARNQWRDLSAIASVEGGFFDTSLPVFEPGGEVLRLIAERKGCDPSEPFEVSWPSIEPIEIRMPSQAFVELLVVDENDAPIPAKITLRRSDDARTVLWAPPWSSQQALPPGDYSWSATRGFEHQPMHGQITVVSGEPVRLDAKLPRLLNTEGWLASDSHIHSSPSEDSDVMIELRLLTLAAEGVEAFIGSDHEIITDLSPWREKTGLTDWVASVVGAELTSASTEHHTIAGLEARPLEPRGGIVAWGGLDMAQTHEGARQRGAQLIGLNHPRHGCNWLCLIDWDRLTGLARVANKRLLGLPDDAQLFSWDFDFIEYMNGPISPFMNPDNPRETGLFEDWQAMLNLGHRIVAVGASDAHGLSGVGDARSYVQSDVQVRDFVEADYLQPMLDGRVLVSAGAFAEVSIQGVGMGGTVQLDGDEVALELSVRALPEIDVDWILVTYNCDEVLRIRTDNPDDLIKFDGILRFAVQGDGHVAVMGFGSSDMPNGLANYRPDRTPRFTTNAIYVDADGDGEWTAPGGKTCSYNLTPP
jgi:hypothetical protein